MGGPIGASIAKGGTAVLIFRPAGAPWSTQDQPSTPDVRAHRCPSVPTTVTQLGAGGLSPGRGRMPAGRTRPGCECTPPPEAAVVPGAGTPCETQSGVLTDKPSPRDALGPSGPQRASIVDDKHLVREFEPTLLRSVWENTDDRIDRVADPWDCQVRSPRQLERPQVTDSGHPSVRHPRRSASPASFTAEVGRTTPAGMVPRLVQPSLRVWIQMASRTRDDDAGFVRGLGFGNRGGDDHGTDLTEHRRTSEVDLGPPPPGPHQQGDLGLQIARSDTHARQQPPSRGHARWTSRAALHPIHWAAYRRIDPGPPPVLTGRDPNGPLEEGRGVAEHRDEVQLRRRFRCE